MKCAESLAMVYSARPTTRGRDLYDKEEPPMSEHVYKILELVGSSKTSIEEAVQNAVTKASATVRNMRWFEVVETRGYIEDGKVGYWQVTVKIGFTIED
jgi:flavin-binding protein dodecin